MIPKIILANEQEFDCNFCGVSSTGVMYIDLVGVSLAQAVTLFSNAENTSKIIYRTFQGENAQNTVYNNFSVLIGVQYVQNLDGLTRVSMRRPYVGE